MIGCNVNDGAEWKYAVIEFHKPICLMFCNMINCVVMLMDFSLE